LDFTNHQGIGPLYLAIKGEQVDSINYLLSKNVAIFNLGEGRIDNSPIFFAIRQENLKAIELICDRNLKVLNDRKDSQGNVAILHRKFEAVNYLSVRGLNLNVCDSEGRSLLLRVLMEEKSDLAKNLIQRGADIDFRNHDGTTALSMAIQMQRIPIAKYLVVNGASAHLEDGSGRDSCDYAQIHGVKSIPEIAKCQTNLRQKWHSTQATTKVLKEIEDRANTVKQKKQEKV
jgi:uncharacterized protein